MIPARVIRIAAIISNENSVKVSVPVEYLSMVTVTESVTV